MENDHGKLVMTPSSSVVLPIKQRLMFVSLRQMILHGCVAFALHAGAMRVESELLPQCWEQVGTASRRRRGIADRNAIDPCSAALNTAALKTYQINNNPGAVNKENGSLRCSNEVAGVRATITYNYMHRIIIEYNIIGYIE